MTPSIIAYTPAIVGLIGISLFVILRNGRKVNILFAALLSVVVVWQFLLMLSTLLGDGGLIALRAAIFVSNFMPYLFVLFAYAFPEGKGVPIKIGTLFAIPTVSFCAISFSDQMITAIQQDPHGLSPNIDAGYLYTLQTAYTVGYLLIGLVNWVKKLFQARNSEQRQLFTLLLIAFAFPVLINFLIGYVFVGVGWLQLFAPSSLVVTAGIIAYSMIRHRLFDIRGLVGRAVVNVLLLGLISYIYAVVILNLGSSIFEQIGLGQSKQALYVISMLVVAVSFGPLSRIFRKITKGIFFRDEYSAQDVLDEISSILTRTTGLTYMMRDVLKSLGKTLQPEFSQLMIADRRGTIQRCSTLGKRDGAPSKLSAILVDNKKPMLILDDLHASHPARQYLQDNGIAVVVRLNISKEHLGYLVFGYKQSGYAYSHSDTYLMSIVGEQLTVGLQNQLRFQEIQAFNETLRKKVDEATAELRESNKKLKSLDEAKDEFISMASHQLRTPLTSVKGYISMVLEEDAGKLNSTQRQLLEQAFASSQRMVYLISDFLNVSRLQTGKFTIERTAVVLSTVAKQEVDQLRPTAESRNITLECTVPSDFPMLQLDEAKIRQAIMNFVDNAIFYSKPGGTIKVNLIKTAKDLELTVQDQGIGVPMSERHHLFNKFYRASNARVARPDGTGIGLFMAKKVVVAHGGSIIFSSVEGKGSTFGFRLPLKQPPAGLAAEDHPKELKQ